MPEFSPLFCVRKGGNSLSRGSTSRAIRRSEKPARTAMPRATWSRAIASACAWKFPPLMLVPSGKMSGLSVAAFISTRRDAAAPSRVERTAPRTCGTHRSVYGSCTRCGPLWDGMISLRRRRRRRFAATSRAPGCGFSPTRRSSNGFGEPRRASKDIEAATCASFNNRRPSWTTSAPTAAITDVPLMIATPSFDCRIRGASFAPARAFPPERTRPPSSASPSPTRTRPKCARGARSPLAPSDPRDGITGWTPRFKKSKRRVTSTRRTPGYPLASVFARRRIAARTSSRRRGGPWPIAWLRSRLSCNVRTSASEIATLARSPKPVLMPYARVPFATTFSSARRLASTRFAAAGASRTVSRVRATAITSSRSRDRPSIERMRNRRGIPVPRYMLGADAQAVKCPRAIGTAVHADRLPRDVGIVADPEAERERGRDQARSRGPPLRLRRGHAAAVHAEHAELHAGLARLRLALPRGPFPRPARHGAKHVDERTRSAPRGVRTAGDRAARHGTPVPGLLHAGFRGPGEGADARRGDRRRRVRGEGVRGGAHGPLPELRPRGEAAARPLQPGARGGPRRPERPDVQPPPGGRIGAGRRPRGPSGRCAGAAEARPQDRVHRRHDAPRVARRDRAPRGRPDPRCDVRRLPRREGEPLRTLVLAAGGRDRQGGGSRSARPDAPEPALRGTDEDPRGREEDLRKRPSRGRLRGDRGPVSGVRPSGEGSGRIPYRWITITAVTGFTRGRPSPHASARRTGPSSTASDPRTPPRGGRPPPGP